MRHDHALRHFIPGLVLTLCTVSLSALADSDPRVEALLDKAITAAGGDAWTHGKTLNVVEEQTRYVDGKPELHHLNHTMDLAAAGYRLELKNDKGNFVYGWDGQQFWATADGKAGDEALVKEARRVIADAYYRFSLPYILGKSDEELTWVGNEEFNGATLDVIRTEYHQGPADRYFSGRQGHQEHTAAHGDRHAEKHDDKPADKHAAAAGSSTEGHGQHGGGHHSDNEVYYFGFNADGQLAMVRFSHHGDGTYETLTLVDYRNVDGATREQMRTLEKPDGAVHYESRFTQMSLVDGKPGDHYRKP